MTVLQGQLYLLEVPIIFRLATPDDLPKLEWFGQYAHFRSIFQRTFAEQCAGKRFMLVADFNHFPIGQIFGQINPAAALQPSRAYFYSLRVMDMFRGHGIGSWLLHEAEKYAQSRECERAAIAAAKDNPRARRLYERKGYRVISEDRGEWSYVDHLGRVQQVREPCWVLEKPLILR